MGESIIYVLGGAALACCVFAPLVKRRLHRAVKNGSDRFERDTLTGIRVQKELEQILKEEFSKDEEEKSSVTRQRSARSVETVGRVAR